MIKEIYNKKEDQELDEELLSEEALTIVLTILALPSVIALIAWAGSIIVASYIKAIRSIMSKTIGVWKGLLKRPIGKEEVTGTLEDLSSDKKVDAYRNKNNKNKRAFNSELKDVYLEIEAKNFESAKEAFDKTPKYIQNNPDVHRVLISEISKSLKEPPIYISSPGNETYRAIKKVINIRVAKASAFATRMTIEKRVISSDALDGLDGLDDLYSGEEIESV